MIMMMMMMMIVEKQIEMKGQDFYKMYIFLSLDNHEVFLRLAN